VQSACNAFYAGSFLCSLFALRFAFHVAFRRFGGPFFAQSFNFKKKSDLHM
jgi:hypothetical protein